MTHAAEPAGDDGALYAIAGTNLSGFVRSWLAELDQDDIVAQALSKRAGQGYEYGALLLMADVALAAARPAASRETLLTYAVIAIFQQDDFPGRTTWTTAADHVEHAFRYAAQLGPTRLARALVQSVVDRSKNRSPVWHEAVLHRLLPDTAAAHAAYDQRIAQFRARDIRAATALDPTIMLDQLLLEQE